jgi:hypothetical protein
MSWLERLENFEMQGVSGVSKVSKSTFDTLDTAITPIHPKKSANIPRHSYHFRLHNGDGGTLITDADTLEAARVELVARYGDRLAVVTEAHDRNG